MGLIEDIKGWIRKNGAPFTVLLIASFVAVIAFFWSSHLKGMDQILLSNVGQTPIWAYLTYPWANAPFSGLDLMFFVFLLIWLYQVGSPVEREMGTIRYAALWFAATLVPGLIVIVGATLFKLPVHLMAPYLPESAVTIVWCTRNKTATVMLWGLLPLNGVWLGWVTALLDLILYGFPNPPIGFLACLHLIGAYFFAADRIPFLPYAGEGGAGMFGNRAKGAKKEATTRGQVRYDQSYFDDVRRREQERSEQERLKKLFGEDDHK